ncbi:unnamed protein product [Effrenium voratum]|uniref:HPP family protein n=1 Tax=Effrenium voratum TaxID=2562239 RepID=A0AA36IP57_9DINO|nr:unnamed protein product [Effrenium voratum]CAJ1458661.1 unnamed protein product [Effrenium voratum]
MVRSRLDRLSGLAVVATVLSGAKAFSGIRPARVTLVGPRSEILTEDSITTGHTARQAEGKALGGQQAEGFFTAIVAALSTFAMSSLQHVLKRQLWVPPFGAVALIFAADAVAAAKEGKIMCFKTMRNTTLKACVGVAGACLLTVLLARLLGDSPSVLRASAMFVAALSMSANPSSGYFPPAGALCALYVEKAVVKGALPGFEYALFPCATGVALLLVFSRVFTFMMAQPLWVLRPRKGKDEKELLTP